MRYVDVPLLLLLMLLMFIRLNSEVCVLQRALVLINLYSIIMYLVFMLNKMILYWKVY